MKPVDVSVIVTPRERFDMAAASLDSLLANTPEDCEIIYVDAGSPRAVRGYLQRHARRLTHLRVNRYLSPNQARNLGWRHARGEYFVFVDNDVTVSPGWLEPLVACARETDAVLVGPLYLEIAAGREVIHMAGGETDIVEEDGRRVLKDIHYHFHEPLAGLEESLVRRETGEVEFHCMLVRAAELRRMGGLDEGLWSVHEHIDLCLAMKARGGRVMLEPASRVTYTKPYPLGWRDLPFFLLRWSDTWNDASLWYFNRKWNLQDDHYGLRKRFIQAHRNLALKPLERRLAQWLGPALAARHWSWICRRVLEMTLRGRVARGHQETPPPPCLPPLEEVGPATGPVPAAQNVKA